MAASSSGEFVLPTPSGLSCSKEADVQRSTRAANLGMRSMSEDARSMQRIGENGSVRHCIDFDGSSAGLGFEKLNSTSLIFVAGNLH